MAGARAVEGKAGAADQDAAAEDPRKLVPVPEFVDEFIAATAGNDKKMNAGADPPLIDYILEARGLNARGWAVTPDAFRPTRCRRISR